MSLVKMPRQMLGRPILHKQTSYGFYRLAAIVLVNKLAFSASCIFIFSIIMTSFRTPRAQQAFFTYMALFAMRGFFRAMGMLCTNFDFAFCTATFSVPNAIPFCGSDLRDRTVPLRARVCLSTVPPFEGAGNGFVRTNPMCDGANVIPMDPIPPNTLNKIRRALCLVDSWQRHHHRSKRPERRISGRVARNFDDLLGFVIALGNFPVSSVASHLSHPFSSAIWRMGIHQDLCRRSPRA